MSFERRETRKASHGKKKGPLRRKPKRADTGFKNQALRRNGIFRGDPN
jgi:hypothetical protein